MWRPFESILGAFVSVSFPLFTDFLLLLAVVLAAAVFLDSKSWRHIIRFMSRVPGISPGHTNLFKLVDGRLSCKNLKRQLLGESGTFLLPDLYDWWLLTMPRLSTEETRLGCIAWHGVRLLSLLHLVLAQLVQGPSPAQKLPGLATHILGVHELSDPLEGEVLLRGGQREDPLLYLRVREPLNNDLTAQLVWVGVLLSTFLCRTSHTELSNFSLPFHLWSQEAPLQFKITLWSWASNFANSKNLYFAYKIFKEVEGKLQDPQSSNVVVLTYLYIDRLVKLVVLSSYQICYFSCFISVPGLSLTVSGIIWSVQLEIK